MCNVLTVPTVWYINCHQQCGIFYSILSGTVKIPHSRNSKNIPYCWWQLKYHTVGAVKIPHCRNTNSVVFQLSPTIWNILTVPRVWYLTVPDNVECSYCSKNIPHCRSQLNTTLSEQKEHSTLSGTVKIPQCKTSENIPHCREQLTYHTVGTCGILTVPDNVQCPRQCEMLLLFLQCGILNVHDNVEWSYCSYSVVC
jgi:hypothetical protein